MAGHPRCRPGSHTIETANASTTRHRATRAWPLASGQTDRVPCASVRQTASGARRGTAGVTGFALSSPAVRTRFPFGRRTPLQAPPLQRPATPTAKPPPQPRHQVHLCGPIACILSPRSIFGLVSIFLKVVFYKNKCLYISKKICKYTLLSSIKSVVFNSRRLKRVMVKSTGYRRSFSVTATRYRWYRR
jgi:hypothetical protein